MRMKDRITVTIDTELAGHAKRAAHLRGTSVSSLVESTLRKALEGQVRPDRPFAARWAGRFTVASGGDSDARLEGLKAKHGLK